jgi:hypothetical protein
MSAVVALRVARAAGVELALDGTDLSLKAASEPPATVLDALQRHKTEIVAMLRSERVGWSAEDWRLYFEERAAIAEFDGGLPRAKAEAQAFECCIDEWLNRNPTPSAPGRCAWCGRSESHAPVVPFGTEPETWLHRECWSAWRKMRPFQAQEALNRMGIGDLSDGSIVTGDCGHSSNEHQQQ